MSHRVAFSVFVAVLLAGCGSDEEKSVDSSALDSGVLTTTSTCATPPCGTTTTGTQTTTDETGTSSTTTTSETGLLDTSDTGSTDTGAGDTAATGTPPACVALEFDGISTEVTSTGDLSEIHGTEQLTVESWVSYETGMSGGPYRTLMSIGWGDESQALLWFTLTDGDACGEGGLETGILMAEFRGSGNENICIRTTRALSPSSWHHVAFVFERGNAKLLVDGMEADLASDPSPLGFTALRAPDVTETRIGWGNGYHLGGRMAGTAVHGATIFGPGFAPSWPLADEGVTAAAWPMNMGTGNIVYDLIAGDHGAMINGSRIADCP